MTKDPPSFFMHRDSLGNDTLARSDRWQTRAEQTFEKDRPVIELDPKSVGAKKGK